MGIFFWYLATEIDQRKRNLGSILIVLVVGLCAIALTPINKSLRGGIDIVGGSSFTLAIQPNIDEETGLPLPITQESRIQAKSTIEKRIDPTGAEGALITLQGNKRINVQVPGVDEEGAKRIRTLLEKTAKLEFRAVHPRNAELADRVKSGVESVPGYKVYTYTPKGDDATERNVLLSRRLIIDGSAVNNARASLTEFGTVLIGLNGEGAKKMSKATSKMALGRDQLASVLDGEVVQVATVQSILGKSFQITGLDSEKEAREVANAILNPLQNPLIMEEERSVSATLGKATVKEGITAGIAGLGLTLVFVLLYYRMAGVIAILGLFVNIAILFGLMAMFDFTFTLPGIAGIILTIGIAVDANVLIYERLREEIEAGKSLKFAVKSAFDKAFSAIFDANITTLLIAGILFWRASGTIKGFATTLTLGIIASMFAALICTRVLFWWSTDKKIIKKLSFMDIFPNSKIHDFLSKRKAALILSLLLVAIAFGSIGAKRDKALGVDFLGGSILTFQLGDKSVKEEAVTESLKDLTLTKEVLVQEQFSQASGSLISVRSATADAEQIVAELRKDIPALSERIASTGEDTNGTYAISLTKEEVSATLGKEFLTNSMIALGLGLFVILIYITLRFEFSFALGAFVALFHDLLISIGIVVLLGREISLIHIGAFLTIAGYSINDTIVVFDRIREMLRIKSGSVKDIMNEAISTTLSRTILTSATTFVAVLVLAVFGGPALRDFSLTIMIGVIIGTYSSIFVASSIVYVWSRKRNTNLRREVIEASLENEILEG